MPAAIDLQDKLSRFNEPWAPRTVAEFNGHDIMVARLQGEYHWHTHPDSDDFFLVLKGRLEIDLPDGTVALGPGQVFVVPRGLPHRPRAVEGEAHILLIEPSGTPNSGDPATAAPRQWA